MKRAIPMILAVLMLFMAGCSTEGVPAATQPGAPGAVATEPTVPTVPTTPTVPGTLDENGDGLVNWIALGDSITQGYYSYLDESGKGVLAFDKNQCWAQYVANSTGWALTNSGVGGSGYVHPATVLDKVSGREHIDNMDFAGAELVTLAFGINDWKGNQPLGTMEDDIAAGGTFYSNMRYCIEKIRNDSPNAEIVVIAPLNSCRYGYASKGWSLSYKFYQSKTLQDVYNAMEEVCAYYSLPLIDLTHNEEINNDILNWLPDGVHPSLEKHKRLAEILEEALKKVLPAR